MLRWKSSLKPAAAAPSDDNPGTTNLVGDWSMDETSGTRADSHGTNNLTDNNTVGSTTGVISNAASFVSANSEYLSSTTVPVSGTGARSMEVWFKTSTTGTMHIAGFGGSNSGTNGAAFRLSIESGSLFCRVYGGYAEFGGSWNDGAWHQVVLKVMASGYVRDLEVYVDGSSQTRVAGSNLDFTTINTGTDEFSVGKNIQSSATNYFNGDVDILRIFNDELTAAEITWLYNSGSGRSYSDIAGTTDYRSTILADSPVAYWRLGEASGTTASDEIGSSDGSYGGDTTYGVTGALTGDSNTSVSFAGSTTQYDAITVSSLTTASYSSGITIEFWANWDSTSYSGFGIEAYRDSNNRIFLDARGSSPHWDFRISGTWYSAVGAGFQDGWHLYAFTHDGTNAKTYRDGVLQNTQSASATPFDPTSMGIGQGAAGYNVFTGGIDEVAIYNSALSATDLLAHYTAGTTGGTTYLFDESFEGTGTPTGFTNSISGSGTIDYDHTTNVLEGSKSLHIYSDSDTYAYLDLGSEYDHIVAVFGYYNTSASNRTDVSFCNSALTRNATNSLKFGSVSAYTKGVAHSYGSISLTFTGSINTFHYVRVELDVSGGVVKIARSNDKTSFPTSGTNYAEDLTASFNSSYSGTQYIVFGFQSKVLNSYYDDIEITEG